MSNFSDVHSYYSYQEFMQLMEQLTAAGKTTGPVQSESLIYFTGLNLQRSQRWNKTFAVPANVAVEVSEAHPQIWWVITEAWCGDSAQNLPVINKIAEASGGVIELRIVLRDEHTEIIDKYLTNGGRSIPKLVSETTDGNELFTWGPRPVEAQQIMTEWKANQAARSHDEVEKDLHLWYAKDKGKSVLNELVEKMKSNRK